MRKPLFIILVCIACFFHNISAQGTLDVTIQLDKSINPKNILCAYNDGERSITVTDTFVNNRLHLSRKYYSHLAYLSIQRRDTMSGSAEFFIGSKPATIVFQPERPGQPSLSNYKCTNAIEIDQMKQQKELREFSKNEMQAVSEFYQGHNREINPRLNDSVNLSFKQLLSNLNERNLLFIKQHPEDYFSFWYFRTQIVPNALFIDKHNIMYLNRLLDFFKTIFPSRFRESEEGENIRRVISEVIQSDNIKVGMPAPDFSAADITQKQIRLSDFAGKYVLIDFWASWCPSCMQEIPFIKRIQEDYPSNKLSIIGISWDRDSIAFNKAIQENKMDWIHIFGNENIFRIFNVDAIPQIILIDTHGKILYSSVEKNNRETLLAILHNL